MIGWMLRAVVVAALLVLAGEVAERALAALHRSRRWAWASVLLLGAVLPLVPRFLPAALHALFAPLAPPAPVPPEALAALLAASAAAGRALPAGASWTPAVLLGWAVASAVLLVLLGYTLARLRVARRSWVSAQLEGEPVLVSDAVGPAVVGLLRPAVVVPAWVAGAPASERALVLAHERAHIRAGDPWLLAGAALVSALVPWNPALWWARRRLHAAVESDCDARVLGSGADRLDYARLLVFTAARGAGRTRPLAALVEPRSLLERRIRTMLQHLPRRPLHALVLFGVALAIVVVACDVSGPTGERAGARPSSATVATAAAPARPPAPSLENADSIYEITSVTPMKTATGERVFYVRTGRAIPNPVKAPSSAATNGQASKPIAEFHGQMSTARTGPAGSIGGSRIRVTASDGPPVAEYQGQPPLWLVDGRTSSQQEVNTLRPEHIREMRVWKGDEASARFPQAVKGQPVIEITTK